MTIPQSSASIELMFQSRMTDTFRVIYCSNVHCHIIKNRIDQFFLVWLQPKLQKKLDTSNTLCINCFVFFFYVEKGSILNNKVKKTTNPSQQSQEKDFSRFDLLSLQLKTPFRLVGVRRQSSKRKRKEKVNVGTCANNVHSGLLSSYAG